MPVYARPTIRQFAVVVALIAVTGPAGAVDLTGTVGFTGQVTFAAPVVGITETDLTVSVDSETESTGNGEQCEITATTSDNPDVLGAYPDAGTVSADMTISAGGPNIPDGSCVVKITATGTDGVSVSARGSQTLFVPAGDIDTSATVNVAEIVVRESKAVAGLEKDCVVWTKKQLKLRDKCNSLLLKKGPTYAPKCKDAGPEPVGCDPGQHVEAILALAHAANDQQTDPVNAEAVDAVLLKDQVLCQKRFGKAAVGFVNKYVNFVNKKCVAAGVDDEQCRNQQSNDSKSKLDQIDKCVTDQLVDGNTGRTVPVVGAPCHVCITAGQLPQGLLRGHAAGARRRNRRRSSRVRQRHRARRGVLRRRQSRQWRLLQRFVRGGGRRHGRACSRCDVQRRDRQRLRRGCRSRRYRLSVEEAPATRLDRRASRC